MLKFTSVIPNVQIRLSSESRLRCERGSIDSSRESSRLNRIKKEKKTEQGRKEAQKSGESDSGRRILRSSSDNAPSPLLYDALFIRGFIISRKREQFRSSVPVDIVLPSR